MMERQSVQPTYRRTRKLIQPRIQLRLIGVFLGGALLSAILVTLLVARELTYVADDMPHDGVLLSELTLGLLGRSLVLALAVAAPLVASVGLLVTFRIAGPLYRFEVYLRDVIDGRESGPCRIRKGDELGALCDLITEATEPVRSAGEQDDASAEREERAA